MTTPMGEFTAEQRKEIFKRQMAAKMLALKNDGSLNTYLTQKFGDARFPNLVKGHEMPGALAETFIPGQTGYDSATDRPGGEIGKIRVDAHTGALAAGTDPSEKVPSTPVHPKARERAPLRLNAGWIDMHDTDIAFTPNPAQNMYLWIIREDGHLILGVEDPGKTIEGLAVDKELRELDAIQGLGHPTLAAMFLPDGTLDIGRGRIGGELRPASGGWKLNSSSGRYSGNRGDVPTVLGLLQNAADVFRGVGVGVCEVEHWAGSQTHKEKSPV